MREEVGVYGNRYRRGHPITWVMYDPQIQQPPSLDDAAADGHIQDARKKRHAQHFGISKIWIGPGLDAVGCLEDFEGKTDDVKQADRLASSSVSSLKAIMAI